MLESLINNNENNLRDSTLIDNEMKQFISEHEGDMIINDIILLEDMGYERKMINKIYILLKPENMERAIDYMTEIDGIYQHDFFESNHKSKDKDLCFICKMPRKCHINYLPNDLDNNDQYNVEENDLLLTENKKDSITLNIKNEDDIMINNICNVCFEDVEGEDLKFNLLPCNHVCCTECWTNYLKSLINEAKVDRIKCVEYKCKEEIPEDFIFKHINNDEKLIEKYNKFKIRANILKDPNKKFCPEPDCESFLEKNSEEKYVQCKNGHEFCFECLRKPHGNSSCEQFMEKEFMTWKKDKRVKRCPRCKIYTEKNEGCNHMTCTSCKYQWCWLCEEEYTYGHYDGGKCKGFQFTKADNLEEAKKTLDYSRSLLNYDYAYNNRDTNCCFSLNTIFPCFFTVPRNIRINSCQRFQYSFLMWFIGFLGITYFTLFDSPMFNHANKSCGLFIMVIIIGFTLFIPYQLLFTCLITPFILICFVSESFFKLLLKFLCMNVR